MKVYHNDVLGELIVTDENVTFHEISDYYGPNSRLIKNAKIRIGSSESDDSGINICGFVQVPDNDDGYYESVCYDFFPINK